MRGHLVTLGRRELQHRTRRHVVQRVVLEQIAAALVLERGKRQRRRAARAERSSAVRQVCEADGVEPAGRAGRTADARPPACFPAATPRRASPANGAVALHEIRERAAYRTFDRCRVNLAVRLHDPDEQAIVRHPVDEQRRVKTRRGGDEIVARARDSRTSGSAARGRSQRGRGACTAHRQRQRARADGGAIDP